MKNGVNGVHKARVDCRHPERWLEYGVEVPNDQHSCVYVDARNRLIAGAEQLANTLYGKRAPIFGNEAEPEKVQIQESWNARWSRAFHDEMTRQARETGLQR